MTWEHLVECSTKKACLQLADPGLSAEQAKVSRRLARAMLYVAFTAIADTVMHGERVVVPTFGTFYRATRKARRIKDINSSAVLELPATVAVGFHCSKAIKR